MILFKTHFNNFKKNKFQKNMGLHDTFYTMQTLWSEGFRPFLFEAFSPSFFAFFKPVGCWVDFEFVACHKIGACHES